ncbi:hypothetical protein GH714_012503 [Hevea brasiliensis]|uniref:Disease resistance protein At4g27190-like leucine-rich repeats domain-containing protein n=1 Tax=Hevea brasiliensis TaxID=3981 RepID=A0A6A6KZR5_HEVBR|nr:hypothetical protein GH714_012503 [Hevea brasiliensis]
MGSKCLLRETEDLYLDEVRGAENVLYDIDGDGFPQLTHLHVQKNTVIQHIINMTKWAACDAFPILESLILRNLMNLEKICHGQLAAGSFNKLEILKVTNCNRLTNLFSLSTARCLLQLRVTEVCCCFNMEAIVIDEDEDSNEEVVEFKRFQRLEELNVDNCISLQEIYQLEGFNVIEAFELRKLSIQSLPSLKHVWRKDPQGVFTFQNLKSVEVSNCDVLKNLFPASIAESLLQLENLTIIKCGVEEIVAKPEDMEPAPFYCFKFPQLTSLKLIELSELRSFYPGTHISEWQKLKCLEVRNCRKVRKFGLEEVHEEGQHSIPIQQPLLLLEKMSPNLEELTLEHKDLIAIQHGQFSFKHFSKLKVLTLSHLQNRSQLFLIGFLKTMHYVETIVVKSSNLEELFSCEGFTLVRNLKLFVVDNLKQIWDEDSRLKLDLQHLETLSVIYCNSLTNIVPSSSSFPNLATLEVSFCEGLVNLITVSAAKTMGQLTKMTVDSCNKMTEIVTSDGDDHTGDEIIFSKLQILELTYLSSLISFCSGNHTFNFPSLENVKVYECLQMKIFSFGVLNTPKLRGIELANQEHWEGNLNATIESSLSMTYFQASKFPELWHGGNQGRLFHNVQSLTVDQCAISDIPVPANLLQFLNKLEKLQVQYCDSAEIVFDLEGLSVDDGHTELLPQLSKLHLANLPMLRHLWNKDPLGILEFNNLRLLHVENCNSLKNIFTWSTALCLMQLEEIKLSNCNTIEEIIEKEGPEEATSSADKMILPSLKLVDLECLPKFSSFYSGSSNLKCLSLKKLSIYECPSMKNVFGTLLRLHRPNTKLRIFTAGVSSTPKLGKLAVYGHWLGSKRHWEGNLNATIEQLYMKCVAFEGYDVQLSNFPMLKEKWHGQFPFKNLKHLRKLVVDDCAFFSNAVAIPSLEELRVEYNTMKDMWSQADFLSGLKGIELTCFSNDSTLLPSYFFQSLPDLEKLVLSDASFEEIIFHEEIISKETRAGLVKLKELKLSKLPRLKHLMDAKLLTVFQYLETLEVLECGRLEILVPSSVSFQNLKTLEEVQSESQMAERTTTQEYYVEDTHTSQTHFQLVLRLPAAAKL